MYKFTKNTTIAGIFCISLDFEKYWGVRDVRQLNTLGNSFGRIEQLVLETLRLFEKYEICASWATIGMLAHNSREELFRWNENALNCYQNPNYSPFPLSGKLHKEIPDEIIFGNKEIDAIRNTYGQELASHTYSHFYCLEEGVSTDDFQWDLDQMNKMGEKLHHSFKSIVFPRNQINTDHLKRCAASGYTAYRGNQKNRDWANTRFGGESKMQRARRLADAYKAVSKTKNLRPDELEVVEGLINVPASRFLRPHSGKGKLEKLKLKRIVGEMDEAAQKEQLYHLWWHPHNFAERPDKNLEQLEMILQHFQKLNKQFGFVSMNMSEIAAYVKG